MSRTRIWFGSRYGRSSPKQNAVVEISLVGDDLAEMGKQALTEAQSFFGVSRHELRMTEGYVERIQEAPPLWWTKLTIQRITLRVALEERIILIAKRSVIALEMLAFELALHRGDIDRRWLLCWFAAPKTRMAKLILPWRVSRADLDFIAALFGVAPLTDAELAALRGHSWRQ